MPDDDFEVLEPVPAPSSAGRLTNQQILLGKKHDPLELIKIYSEDEWEQWQLLKIGKLDIVLDGELRKHVEHIDFSIVKDIPSSKIIDGHRETRHYAARFGGGLVRLPPDKADVPSEIDAAVESRFV